MVELDALTFVDTDDNNTEKNVLEFARGWMNSNSFFSEVCDVQESLPTDLDCPASQSDCCLNYITAAIWKNVGLVNSGNDGDLIADDTNAAITAYACYASYRKLKLSYANVRNQNETVKRDIRTANKAIMSANEQKKEQTKKTLSLCKNSSA